MCNAVTACSACLFEVYVAARPSHHPFGPHAFRDIVATHVIKTTGSIALAANILLDSEDVVREHYARFLPEDRLKLAMAGMATAFKKKGSK